MKIGDEITVAGHFSRFAVVVEVYEQMIIARACAGNDIGLQYADEGITWVRGQHAEDSTEYTALLAAWKLRLPYARIQFDADTPTAALRGCIFEVNPGDMLRLPAPERFKILSYALAPKPSQ